MTQIRRILLMLCLIMAGALGTWANDYSCLGSTDPINGVTYKLFRQYLGTFFNTPTYSYYASVWKISTNATELTIPRTITVNGIDYTVDYVGYMPDVEKTDEVYIDGITSPNLKTVRFEGNIAICGKFMTTGSVTTMEFLGDLAIRKYGGREIQCRGSDGNLTTYATEFNIKGKLELSGSLYLSSLTELYLLKRQPEFYDAGKIFGPNLNKIYFGSIN